MARPRRNAALPIQDEIRRQGIIAMLQQEGGAADELRGQFHEWLRRTNALTFDQLANEFALAEIAASEEA